MKHDSWFLLLALLLTGCASKQRFGYQISSAASGSATGRTIEVLPISDTRTNRNIDSHFTTNLLEDVRGVVAWELAGTGLFKLESMPAPNPALNVAAEAGSATQSNTPRDGRGAVQTSPRNGATQNPGGKMPPSTAGGTPAATGEKGGPAELRLKTELKRLQWEVPHYDAILANTFLLSLFTGGIGGGIYISTSTQVNGFVMVQFELTEAKDGRVLLNKEYSGFHTEKMAKASCDSSTTRARMASQAFKNAMTQFKADLVKPPSAPPL